MKQIPSLFIKFSGYHIYYTTLFIHVWFNVKLFKLIILFIMSSVKCRVRKKAKQNKEKKNYIILQILKNLHFFFFLKFFCFSLTCWIKITFTIVSHELQVVLSIFFTLSFYKEHSFIFQKTKKTKSFWLWKIKSWLVNEIKKMDGSWIRNKRIYSFYCPPKVKMGMKAFVRSTYFGDIRHVVKLRNGSDLAPN